MPAVAGRESDGLAISPLNAGLSPEERRAAPALFRALLAGHLLHELGEKKARKILAAVRMALEMEPGLRLDALDLVDERTRSPVKKVIGPAVLVAAVYAGKTRLTDSVRFG
jgi:pantoate--beta-alanine ligase